jgi:hypothetical protein
MPAVTDLDDQHHEPVILDPVDRPIVPVADAVQPFFGRELDDTGWAGSPASRSIAAPRRSWACLGSLANWRCAALAKITL